MVLFDWSRPMKKENASGLQIEAPPFLLDQSSLMGLSHNICPVFFWYGNGRTSHDS
jgi:hypothetical protein